MPIQGLKYNIPAGGEQHQVFQATGSFTAYNPNDGYALLALDRTATLLDFDHKLPSQSGGHFPGPINSYLSIRYVDQSGGGLQGQVIVYPAPQQLQIPQFWSIGRAIQTQSTTMDIIEGTQPPPPAAGTCRIWADANGNLFHMHSDGSDPEIWDTRLSLGGALAGTVPNPSLSWHDPESRVPDKTWIVGGAGPSAIPAQNLIRKNEFGYAGGQNYTSIQIGSGPSIALGADVSQPAGGNFNGTNEVIIPNNWRITQINSGATDFLNGILIINNGVVSPVSIILPSGSTTRGVNSYSGAPSWSTGPGTAQTPVFVQGATTSPFARVDVQLYLQNTAANALTYVWLYLDGTSQGIYWAGSHGVANAPLGVAFSTRIYLGSSGTHTVTVWLTNAAGGGTLSFGGIGSQMWMTEEKGPG